jgi:hypothetical protein
VEPSEPAPRGGSIDQHRAWMKQVRDIADIAPDPAAGRGSGSALGVRRLGHIGERRRRPGVSSCRWFPSTGCVWTGKERPQVRDITDIA